MPHDVPPRLDHLPPVPVPRFSVPHVPTQRHPARRAAAVQRARTWAPPVLLASLLVCSTAFAQRPAASSAKPTDRSGAAAPPSDPAPARISRIESFERIEFFTTSGQLSDDGKTWTLPIHGRVYLPVRSTLRKAVIAQTLKTAFGVEPGREDKLRFEDRVDQLLGDNKAGRQVVIRLGERTQALALTGADGHFTGSIEVPVADLGPEALPERQGAGRVTFAAVLPPRFVQSFTGTALLIPPQGRSIISDIDDTVKITNVLDRKRMLEATFVKPFVAVPGMASLYQTWASEGEAVHFLSSSPWHLYAPLAAFLQEAGFPPATVTLKKARLTDTSIQYLFADPTKNKPPEIEALLKAYPQRTFILVGDSGEKDPEIYADFWRRYPARIERVFIRNVTGAKPDDARFAQVFAGLDAARWQLFLSPDELPRSFRK